MKTIGYIFKPRCFDTTITATVGITTAVKINPSIASTNCSPLLAPINGGKIKFPAPKTLKIKLFQ